MPADLKEHAGRHYAVRFHYALPDDAWAVELSEAVPVPVGDSGGTALLPGPAFLVALVPDEDPALEPTVHVHGHGERVVPYEVVRWFMEQVADQVERCRAAFALESAAVEGAAGAAE